MISVVDSERSWIREVSSRTASPAAGFNVNERSRSRSEPRMRSSTSATLRNNDSSLSTNQQQILKKNNKVIHKYNTRQKDDFHIDAIKSEIGKRSIKYKGSKLWNDLPAELKKYSHFNLLNINLKTIYCSL